MKTRVCVIFILLVLLTIPVIDAKPVIIGFNGKIDQDIIKEHGVANYTQYNIINAISADVPEIIFKQLKKNPKIKYTYRAFKTLKYLGVNNKCRDI